MYAIIRAGGKQAKVQVGDVIEIERVKDPGDSVTFVPLLVVSDDGDSVSDRAKLADAKVTAEVLGETKGEKIDIFKYKNKTGYRRRQGHRQKYTQIEITEIKLPGAKAKTASKTAKASDEKAAEVKTSAPKPTASKTAAAKTAAAKTAAAKTTKKETKSSEEE